MRNFKTLWYEVMLTEISHFKSISLLSGCNIWVSHLKETLDNLTALCLDPIKDASDFTIKEQMQTSQMICYHVLQATATAAISIGSQAVNKSEYLDETIKMILQLVPKLCEGPVIHA
jgi:hypothetical protein